MHTIKFSMLNVAVILIFITGCGPERPEGSIPQAKKIITDVNLVLQFSPADKDTYKVATKAQRIVKFEGHIPDDKLYEGGIFSQETEMAFLQEIESVDANGNALARITIKKLKHLVRGKEKVYYDFDSKRKNDKKNLLASLIGQSYTIKKSPVGEVIEVGGLEEAKKLVTDGSSAHKIAMQLLSEEAIRVRHGMLLLPDANENPLSPEDKWSTANTFNFRQMGNKTFERIFTLNEIRDCKGALLAMAGMQSMPDAEKTPGQEDASYTNSFDHTTVYEGQLEFDASAGEVRSYNEDLTIKWIIADPAAGEENPAVIRMTAVRSYRLEKIK